MYHKYQSRSSVCVFGEVLALPAVIESLPDDRRSTSRQALRKESFISMAGPRRRPVKPAFQRRSAMTGITPVHHANPRGAYQRWRAGGSEHGLDLVEVGGDCAPP
jgi:hypothetical protein